MEKNYVLYNPLAGNGECKRDVEALAVVYENCTFIDVHNIKSYKTFLEGLEESDRVILCGGDGTLNHFANDVAGLEIKNPVYLYAVGTGNDFVRDLGKERGADPDFCINAYLKDLPSVTIDGQKRLFINGVGYGIDGYCCEVGDEQREHSDKPVNYTAIAIKGLLFRYKPTDAVVTVDGKKHTYRRVWLAPTMNGRYYGGGMMPTPDQQRLGEGKKISVMVMHGAGKLRTLMIFPSIFKGGHIRHKKAVEVLTGSKITVEFDRPTPLQIDGETVLNVSSYTAEAAPAGVTAAEYATAGR